MNREELVREIVLDETNRLRARVENGWAVTVGHESEALSEGATSLALTCGFHATSKALGENGRAVCVLWGGQAIASGQGGRAIAVGPNSKVRGDVDGVSLLCVEYRDNQMFSVALGVTGQNGVKAGV